MRRFCLTGLLALACVALLTGCPPGPRLTLSGQDPSLVGTWAGTVEVLGAEPREATVVFSIDEFNLSISNPNGEPTTLQGIYAVQRTATPNRIDLGVVNSSIDVRNLRKEVLRGVYRQSGNSLELSYVVRSFLDRPLGVEVGDHIYVLTRISK